MGCICKNNKVTIGFKQKANNVDDNQIKMTEIPDVTFYFDKIQPSSILAIFHFFLYKEIKEIGKINRQFNSISRNPQLFKKFFINSSEKLNCFNNVITVNTPWINDKVMTFFNDFNTITKQNFNNNNNENDDKKTKQNKLVFPSFADYKMLSKGTNQTDMSFINYEPKLIKKQDNDISDHSNILTIKGTHSKSILRDNSNSKTTHELNMSMNSKNSWTKNIDRSNQHMNSKLESISVMEIY